MAREKHACTHRNRKPFVCVKGDGIRPLDATENGAQFRDQRCGSAPCRIDAPPGAPIAMQAHRCAHPETGRLASLGVPLSP
jgi:hypothetical protein